MRWAGALLRFGAAWAGTLTAAGAGATPAVAHYEHIFLIIEENKSYD